MIPQVDPGLLVTLEEAFGQNLLDYVEAIQSITPEVGAQAVSCAGGVAAFCGIDSPLTTIKGAGPEIHESDLELAEQFFRQRGVNRIIFELAPSISESSMERLVRRGYALSSSENVVVGGQPFDTSTSSYLVVPVDVAEWPKLQSIANEAAESPLWALLTKASAQVRNASRFGMKDSHAEWIACAELFEVDEVALFANDATIPFARGRGIQTAMIQHRLAQAAARRFRCVAAEVAPGSISERNYLRCGFRIAYTRSHWSRLIE